MQFFYINNNDNHYDDNLEVVALSYCPYQSQTLLHCIIYFLIGFPLTSVTVIILHILRTNRIASIMSCTLLSLYYQVKLTLFSGRRLTASMLCSVRITWKPEYAGTPQLTVKHIFFACIKFSRISRIG